MNIDKNIWMFANNDYRIDDTIIFNVWQHIRQKDSDNICYFVVRKTEHNKNIVSNLSQKERAYIVWRNSRKHERLSKSADFVFVSDSPNDAIYKNAALNFEVPIVVIPSKGADPNDMLKSDGSNGCIFRFVAENISICRYLTIAKGFKPYQIIYLPQLYTKNDFDRFKHSINVIYSNIKYAQENSIAFVGFALTHVGGTPIATHALAEGLLEKGWLVKYINLRIAAVVGIPQGVCIMGIEDYYHKKCCNMMILDRMCAKSLGLSHLKYDPADFLPASGLKLRKTLRRLKVRILVSTRESLHLFINEVHYNQISRRKKVYFFHCSSDVIEENFGSAVFKLRDIKIGKAIFVTESNRVALRNRFGISNYDEYCVLGNGLGASRMINRDEIQKPLLNNGIKVCWPVRIEENRKEDFENLFNFASYLKIHDVGRISISVYGRGAYVDSFKKRISDLGVGNIIFYKGLSCDMKKTYSECDAVVDFSKIQSFGMVYIESVLNGKMIFCYRNEGSSEVLRDIPNAFFYSNEELLRKLQSLKYMKLSELRDNYNKIASRFSYSAIADRFVSFVDSSSEAMVD